MGDEKPYWLEPGYREEMDRRYLVGEGFLKESAKELAASTEKIEKQLKNYTCKVRSIKYPSGPWIQCEDFPETVFPQVGIADIHCSDSGYEGGTVLRCHGAKHKVYYYIKEATVCITFISGRKVYQNIHPDLAPILMKNLIDAWKGVSP